MAGDWIKMRADLHSHPKVVRMASALKADKLRVIGGLHAVWCLFDVHSVDGILDGYTLEALDDHIGFPGFGAAMVAIKWLEVGEESLLTPRFDEHNGQSAKRRAQETERKREARSMSAPDADKKRTREEKRREEKNTPKAPKGAAVDVPEWVPAEQWDEFVAMRRAKGQRTPFTVGAAKGVIAKLDTFRAAGHDLAEVLRQSTVNGWADVYEPKPADQRKAPGSGDDWTRHAQR